MAKLHPRFASASAIPRPIPLAAPVTTAVRFSSRIFPLILPHSALLCTQIIDLGTVYRAVRTNILCLRICRVLASSRLPTSRSQFWQSPCPSRPHLASTPVRQASLRCDTILCRAALTRPFLCSCAADARKLHRAVVDRRETKLQHVQQVILVQLPRLFGALLGSTSRPRSTYPGLNPIAGSSVKVGSRRWGVQ